MCNTIYMEGYIYRAYLPSGISYIGQTINLNSRKTNHYVHRYDQHPFHSAILLFGRESITWDVLEVIAEDDTHRFNDMMNERERFWISYFDSYEDGLNDDTGGTCGYKSRFPSEYTRKIQSEANRNKPKSEESKQKNRDSHLGKTASESTKQLMSSQRQGENNGMYGKNHTQESLNRISDNTKKGMAKPGVIDKISAAHKGTHRVYHSDGTYHMEH